MASLALLFLLVSSASACQTIKVLIYPTFDGLIPDVSSPQTESAVGAHLQGWLLQARSEYYTAPVVDVVITESPIHEVIDATYNDGVVGTPYDYVIMDGVYTVDGPEDRNLKEQGTRDLQNPICYTDCVNYPNYAPWCLSVCTNAEPLVCPSAVNWCDPSDYRRQLHANGEDTNQKNLRGSSRHLAAEAAAAAVPTTEVDEAILQLPNSDQIIADYENHAKASIQAKVRAWDIANNAANTELREHLGDIGQQVVDVKIYITPGAC